jgi:hypothetical protein
MSQMSMDAAVVSGIMSTERALIHGADIVRQDYVATDGGCWVLLVFSDSTNGIFAITWFCHVTGQSRALSKGVIQEAGIDTVFDALDTARLAVEAVLP